MTGVLDHLLGLLNGRGETIRARKPEPFSDEFVGEFGVEDSLIEGQLRSAHMAAGDTPPAQTRPDSAPEPRPQPSTAANVPEPTVDALGANASPASPPPAGAEVDSFVTLRQSADYQGSTVPATLQVNASTHGQAPVSRENDAGAVNTILGHRSGEPRATGNGGYREIPPIARESTAEAAGRERPESPAVRDMPVDPAAKHAQVDANSKPPAPQSSIAAPMPTRPAISPRDSAGLEPQRRDHRAASHDADSRPDAFAPLRIEIGRVEIHAPRNAAPVPAPRSKPARRSTAIDLDSYLAGRSGKS